MATTVLSTLTGAYFWKGSPLQFLLAFPPVSLILLWLGYGWARWVAALTPGCSALAMFITAIWNIPGTWTDPHKTWLTPTTYFAMALANIASAAVLLFADEVLDFAEWRHRNALTAHWEDLLRSVEGGAAKQAVLSGGNDPLAPNRLLHAAKRHLRVGRVVGVAVVLLWLLCAAVFLLFLYIALSLAGAPTPMAYWGVPLYILEAYATFFLVPFVLSMPFALPIALLMRSPARILLLRPFNQKKMGRLLAGVARQDLAGFGHVYTIADSTIKVAWYLRIPLLFGELSLFAWRLKKVRRPRHLRRVMRTVRRTWARNLNWLFSRNKVFPLACNDLAWRATVSGLMLEVDLVVVDLTGIRAGVLWEIEQSRKLHREGRLLFLVDAHQHPPALDLIQSALGSSAPTPSLLTYGSNKIDEHRAIRTAAADVLGGQPQAVRTRLGV